MLSPYKLRIMLSASVGMNILLFMAWHARVQKFDKLQELSHFMGHMILEKDVEMTEFEQIALRQLIREQNAGTR